MTPRKLSFETVAIYCIIIPFVDLLIYVEFPLEFRSVSVSNELKRFHLEDEIVHRNCTYVEAKFSNQATAGEVKSHMEGMFEATLSVIETIPDQVVPDSGLSASIDESQ